MSRFSQIAVLALGLALLAGCGPSGSHHESGPVAAKDPSFDTVQKKGKLIVGLDDSFPPMGYRDDSGAIVGFDIDLAQEAAKRLGVAVEFKPVQWNGIIMSLNKGDIDVIWNGLTITEERQKQIIFSKPYLDNRQIIVVQVGSPITDKSSLAGKTVGLQLGSSSETALNSDREVASSLKDVRKYSANTEALMDLAAGRIDAVIVDEVVGRYYISRKPESYRILNDDFGAESYGIGFRKDDESLRDAIDRVLDEMKADGSADKISDQWFGDELVKK